MEGEQSLAEHYRERAAKSGRGIGLRALDVIEIAESRARDAQRRMLEESIALANIIPERAAVVLLDPRGEDADSNAFVKRLRGWNDGGRDVAFVINAGSFFCSARHIQKVLEELSMHSDDFNTLAPI